jgi:mono/diheme cytochrome c family protein
MRLSSPFFIFLLLFVSCGDESLITSETNNGTPAEVILVPNDDPDQCPPFELNGDEVTLHADFVGAENCDKFTSFYQAVVQNCANCHNGTQKRIYNDGNVENTNFAELTKETDWLSHRLNFHTDNVNKTKLVVPGGVEQSYLTQVLKWNDPSPITWSIFFKIGIEIMEQAELMPLGQNYANPNAPYLIKEWIESLENARNIPDVTATPLGHSTAGDMRFRRFYNLFNQRCLDCHGDGGAGELAADFDNERTYIEYFWEKGHVSFRHNVNVAYGDYSSSSLYRVLINNKLNNAGHMPPADFGHPALTESELNIVADWIAGLGGDASGFAFPQCLWENPF